MNFAQPYYFALFIPLAAAAWFVYRRRVHKAMVFSMTGRIKEAGTTWRTALARILPAMALVGIGLSIIALARPQTVFSRVRQTADVIAIEMVVDVSGSMEALDLSEKTAAGMKPKTRLDAVKEAFASFIEKRQDDLIGLVTFGGFATSRAPLTSDHDALAHILKGVKVPKPGLDENGVMVNQEETMTAIGDALATACARLEKAPAKSRIIVLLTDGVSNTGAIQPEQAMKVAEKLKIKIYAIGVGTQGGIAPIMGKDAFGRDVMMQMQMEMDEPLLRKIATSTGGKYYNVQDPDGLASAMQHIDKLEKTKVERDIYRQYNELFPWFLLPGLCLIVLATALNMVLSRRIL